MKRIVSVRKMVGICLLAGAVGVAGGWYMHGKVSLKGGAEATEWERTEPVLAESTLKDKEKCWLCGNDSKSLMGYFRKFDDLGVIYVNDWYVLDFQVRAHDDEGNIISDNGNFTYTNVGTEEAGCHFQVNRNSPRGISEIDIEPGNNSAVDLKKIQQHLCQSCLDKLLEVTVNEDSSENAVGLCLVDFQTLELYPLQACNVSYYVRDYYVRIEHKEEKTEVLTLYAPMQ